MVNFTAKSIRSDKYYKPRPVDMAYRHEAYCFICGEPFNMEKHTCKSARQFMEDHSDNEHNKSLPSCTIDDMPCDDWRKDPRQRAYAIRQRGD